MPTFIIRLSLLIALLLSAGSLFAQRSLYQDALAIAEYKKGLTDNTTVESGAIFARVVPAQPGGELPRIGYNKSYEYLDETPKEISTEYVQLFVFSAQANDKIIITIGQQEY